MEPRILAHLFRKLKEEEKSGLYSQFEIISSHPNLDSRIKSILSFNVPEGFIPSQSWIEWESFKELVSGVNSL